MSYYLKKNKNCDSKKYLEYEASAKALKLNIWSDSNFLEPRQFRKQQKRTRKEF